MFHKTLHYRLAKPLKLEWQISDLQMQVPEEAKDYCHMTWS